MKIYSFVRYIHWYVLVGLVYRLAHGTDSVLVQLNSEVAAAWPLTAQLVTSEKTSGSKWI